MTRLFVGNIPASATSEDVAKLMAKVSPVEEIYFPGVAVTGIHRGFAIVRVPDDEVLEGEEVPGVLDDALDENAEKVEEGDENADGSENAKAKEKKVDPSTLLSTVSRKFISTLNSVHWKGSRLKVSVAKDFYQDRFAQERAETARLVEEKRLAAAEHAAKNDICVLQESVQAVVEGNFKLPKSYRIKVRREKYINFKPQAKARRVFDSNANEVSASENESEDEDEDESTPAVPQGPVGAGVRRGFGTLLASEKKKEAGTDDDCCVDGTVEDLRAGGQNEYDDEGGWTRTKMGQQGPRHQGYLTEASGGISEFDDGMDLVEGAPRREFILEGGDMDVIPAVAPEDVNEEALRFERSRMLKMMMSTFESAASGLAASGAADLSEADEAAMGTKQAPAMAKTSVPAIPTAGRWAGFGARFDPLAEDSSNLELSEEDAAALMRKSGGLVRGIGLDGAAPAAAISGAGAGAGVGTSAGEKEHVDLDELKGIFHRDGGVWWGDGNTLEGQVEKGNATADALFAEAEKMGMDVRDSSEGDGGGMTFGFFDNAPTPVTSINPGIGVGGDSAVPDSASSSLEPGALLASTGQLSSSVVKTLDIATLAAMALPSFKRLLSEARMFSRSETEDVITQNWRNVREKQIVDYKKRNYDARKRAAGQDEAVVAAAAEVAAKTVSSFQYRFTARKRRNAKKR